MKLYRKALLCTLLGTAAMGIGFTPAYAAAANAVPPIGTRHLPVFNEQGGQAKTFANVPVEDVVKYKGNQYGLVYDGAIKENVPGQVNIHPITYDLNGIQIAANVYTPANYDPNKSYAAVVVAGRKNRSPACTPSCWQNRAISPSLPTRPIRVPAAAIRAIPISPSTALKIFTAWSTSFPFIPA